MTTPLAEPVAPAEQAPAPPSPADIAARQTPQASPQLSPQVPPQEAPVGESGETPTETAEASPWDDPETAKAMIAKLRRENATDRATARDTAAREARESLAKDVAKALGMDTGDESPDPDALTKQAQEIDQARTDAATARAEVAVLRTAAAAGADGDALLDSRAFMASLAETDTSDTSAVQQLIAAAVDENPRFRVALVATGASAADHAGGSGEAAVTAEQFAAMRPAQKNALFQSDPALYRQLAGR